MSRSTPSELASASADSVLPVPGGPGERSRTPSATAIFQETPLVEDDRLQFQPRYGFAQLPEPICRQHQIFQVALGRIMRTPAESETLPRARMLAATSSTAGARPSRSATNRRSAATAAAIAGSTGYRAARNGAASASDGTASAHIRRLAEGVNRSTCTSISGRLLRAPAAPVRPQMTIGPGKSSNSDESCGCVDWGASAAQIQHAPPLRRASEPEST